MENQIVHKTDNKNFSEIHQSAKSFTSRCQTVECEDGVLLMADTEWSQMSYTFWVISRQNI